MQNLSLSSELTKGSSFILAFSFLALFSFQDADLVGFWKFLPRQATYLLYHTFGFLSSLFSNFFEVFFEAVVFQIRSLAASLDQLASFFIIPHFRSLVKSFLDFFKSFFSHRSVVFMFPPCSATPVRLGSELVYYTTFSIPCQVLFQNFF